MVLAAGAVSIAVTTRYLGAAGYGRFALALALLQALGVLADAGLVAVVVREASKAPQRTAELVGNALVAPAGARRRGRRAGRRGQRAARVRARRPHGGADRRGPVRDGHRVVARSPRCSRSGSSSGAARSPTPPAAWRAWPRCWRSSPPTSASPPWWRAPPWARPSRWRSPTASPAGWCACASPPTGPSGASSPSPRSRSASRSRWPSSTSAPTRSSWRSRGPPRRSATTRSRTGSTSCSGCSRRW